MQNLTYKILEKHLLKGKLEAGQPIEIKMDQTLTQDATGTMAYMQFEAMGVKKVKTELSPTMIFVTGFKTLAPVPLPSP